MIKNNYLYLLALLFIVGCSDNIENTEAVSEQEVISIICVAISSKALHRLCICATAVGCCVCEVDRLWATAD